VTVRLLIGYSSKHGGTREIAARIAGRFRLANLEVELRPLQEVTEVTAFDAFILGSSIYLGRWNREAVAFVRRHHEVLRGRPVWLFSSGPLGAQVPTDPRELAELRRMIPIRGHQVFGGVLKLEEMSLPERFLAKAMNVSGDYRDWEGIDAWADNIRTQLQADPSAPPASRLLAGGR
jgi:menaquinone-dependent protoporphyrinogen oxidase